MKQIKYIAHCIEDGERFITRFKTKETDEHQLRLIGSRLASAWGAQCMKVEKDDDQSKLDETYDADEKGNL